MKDHDNQHTPKCEEIDDLLRNNAAYASNPANAGDLYLPIRPSKRVAVVACMDARLDVNKLLGLQVGQAHVIRNAGGVVSEDAIRNLVISHHLLNTECWMLIHHTRCGMLAFKDDLLRAGLEGDPNAVAALSGAVGRTFVSPGVSMPDPAHFGAFRGGATALDSDKNTLDVNGHSNFTRLQWDVRRGLSRILNHPWTPTEGPDAVTRARLHLWRGHRPTHRGVPDRCTGGDGTLRCGVAVQLTPR